MRIRITLAALALTCSTMGSLMAQGQTPAGNNAAAAAPAPATRVGVIDIGFIFDNHPTMKPQMKAIDDQMQQAEDEINNRRVAMQKELESMRSLNEASLDYKKKEEYIADQESKLKLDFVRKEKEFSLAKAKIVYDTYKQVEAMTRAVAEANQFAVIVRYSRTEMDPTKPATVFQGLNMKDVVYHSPSIDLTDYVLGQIKAMTPAAPAATVPNNQVPRAANQPGVGPNRK